MTTQQDVRDVAMKVRESANDLRMLEVLGAWITADDVSEGGDSGAAKYEEFKGASGERVNHVQSEQGAQLGTEFDWIIEFFDNYARIPEDENNYSKMTDGLQAVHNCYADDAKNFQPDIQGRFDLGDWDGTFAESLHDNLISPLGDVSINQAHIVHELQAAVLGHWNLVLATRKSMVGIGSATQQALDAVINRPTRDSGELVMPVIGVALAIVGIIAAVPTGGASMAVLPVTLAILGAAHTTVESAIELHDTLNTQGVDMPTVVVQGSTSSEIIQSMIEKINELNEGIKREEETLSGKLKESFDEVESWVKDTAGGAGRKARSWHIQSFRPELGGGYPDPDELDHLGQ